MTADGYESTRASWHFGKMYQIMPSVHHIRKLKWTPHETHAQSVDREKTFSSPEEVARFLGVTQNSASHGLQVELDFVKLLVRIGMYKGCTHLWLSPREPFQKP